MNDEWRSHDCPKCGVPILVGKHSIKLDEQRIAETKHEAIRAAAMELVSSSPETTVEGAEFTDIDGFRYLRISLLERLREALES